ncbi:hypothetical protein CDCA_CDCA10G2932 [Cyanidium caldarium]|uniref:DNA/pantothenate metabolism flavoprotein C-terminal domain-containing protein n=1 Tax=Cyanidium caldarium TaxID=2771 RepID=A0AAV9IX87_CYACA|nr:hypothetical protein CDCA_CDCA10G2932 [Cyanidium caldarium]
MGECGGEEGRDGEHASVERVLDEWASCVSEWLQEVRERVLPFVQAQVGAGRRVALVTSGGTRAPLEGNAVRFLDNFSTGQRGAASVEYLMAHGYAVVFLYRSGSAEAYQRHFAAITRAPAAALQVADDGASLQYTPADRKEYQRMVVAIERYGACVAERRLLALPFETVFEYLCGLREVARALAAAGRSAVLYLSAAVSDFYVPLDRLPPHKMASDGGPVQLQLQPVPKLLGRLRHHWAPQALLVSFKLETDAAVLQARATRALHRYGVDMVVGNLLHTRRQAVTLYSGGKQRILEHDAEETELEARIVDAVVAAHGRHVSQGSAR